MTPEQRMRRAAIQLDSRLVTVTGSLWGDAPKEEKRRGEQAMGGRDAIRQIVEAGDKCNRCGKSETCPCP